MLRGILIFGLVLPVCGVVFGCADRQEIRAEGVAQEAAATAEDDAGCDAKGAPGTPEYDACRQEAAAKRAQKTEIEYQKRRYFDRVLGAGTDGVADY